MRTNLDEIYMLVGRYNTATDAAWRVHLDCTQYEVVIEDEDTEDYVVCGDAVYVLGYLHGRLDGENL